MSLMRISRWFKSIRSKDVLGTRWDEGLGLGGGGGGGWGESQSKLKGSEAGELKSCLLVEACTEARARSFGASPSYNPTVRQGKLIT